MSLALYILKRVLMMIPTLLGITIIVFIIINLAPGSPIEQKLQQMRFGGAGMSGSSGMGGSGERGGAVTEQVIAALKKQYGFDRPMHERYFLWLGNLLRLDFGESFTYEEPVINVILSKLPVSIQFGIISFILTYLICIPLGVWKAVKHGTAFDLSSSFILFVLYSVPSFMLGILLIVFFSGGSFWDLFPIGGISSDVYDSLDFWGKVKDRVHHAVLPVTCYVIGQFTTLTMLMKNSVLEEIKKDYIRTARAKGLSEPIVYLKHALRNALIPIATGIGHFFAYFFVGALLLETLFQLDGMGLLSYKSILSRDYNVIMGMLFIQSGLLLLGNLISDLIYVVVDPRIDFT